MLVLLVIFMVTTPFLFQGAFQVNLPKVAAPNPNLPDAITVSIAPGGRLAVNGSETAFEELGSKLSALLKINPNSTVVLEADSGVSHGTVVGVMGQAYASGVTRLSVAVEQKQGADAGDAAVPPSESAPPDNAGQSTTVN